MSKSLLMASLALSSLLISSHSIACSPPLGIEAASIAERVDSAELVFEGVVTAIDTDVVTVAVKQYFKGEGTETVKVKEFNSHSCSDYLEVDDRWVFFAQGNPEEVLNPVYDSAFGSVRQATPEVFQEIQDNQEHNNVLEGKNCAAVFNGESLYIPCVKVVGAKDVYEARLNVLPNVSNAQLHFGLTDTQEHAPKTPVDNGNGSNEPIYAAVNQVSVQIMESFPVQASSTIDGYLRNGCEKLSPRTQELIKADPEGNFFIDVMVDLPAEDVGCTMAIENFSVTLPLDVLGLSAGEYTVIVNEEHKASFELAVDNVASN